MPDIETDRLLIRTFQPKDLSGIHRILDLALGAGTGFDAEQGLRERKSWLRWSILNQQWLPHLHQPPYGDRAVVLRSTGTLIGAVGLVPLLAPFALIPELRTARASPGHFTSEVGLYWAVDPPHQHRGFASEAARALITYGFQDMHLQRILATTDHANAASQGVMRKLGMLLTYNPLPQPEWLQVVGILENSFGAQR